MIAAPAVDVLDGRCVQLEGGDPDRMPVALEDPRPVADRWLQFGFDVLHPRAEDVGLWLTSSFGARALFGYFCGALTVFYNLAVDFNKPFDGVFTLESGTLTATLRQMRDRVGVYIDV